MADRGLNITNDEFVTMWHCCTVALESLSEVAREQPQSTARELYNKIGKLSVKLGEYADEIGIDWYRQSGGHEWHRHNPDDRRPRHPRFALVERKRHDGTTETSYEPAEGEIARYTLADLKRMGCRFVDDELGPRWIPPAGRGRVRKNGTGWVALGTQSLTKSRGR